MDVASFIPRYKVYYFERYQFEPLKSSIIGCDVIWEDQNEFLLFGPSSNFAQVFEISCRLLLFVRLSWMKQQNPSGRCVLEFEGR